MQPGLIGQPDLQAAHAGDALSAAFEFSQEIVGQLALDALLRSVTERARALMQASGAALCLLDEQKTILSLEAQSGQPNGPNRHRQPITLGLTPYVVGKGATVVTETLCTNCNYLLSFAPGACVVAPLQVGDEMLGALCVVHPAVALGDDALGFTLLANAAALAIVNARLAEQGREQARHAAIHTERERMAAELHDNLAQTLGFLNLKIDQVREMQAAGALTTAAEQLNQMQAAVSRAYNQVRQALTGLAEPAAAGSASAQELAEVVQAFHRDSQLTIDLSLDEAALAELPSLARQQVIHILRESLVNSHRHAQAGRVWVQVEQQNQEVILTVGDDGRGFDPASVDRRSHLGLGIMQQRAARSGGVLKVGSAPGQGTTVTARFRLVGEQV